MPDSSANPTSPARATGVLRTALAFITLGLVVVLGRVVQLQLRPDEALVPYTRAGVRTAPLAGVRGDILDARGRVLSTTRFATRLVIDPHLFPENPHEAIGRIVEATGLDAERIGTRVLRAQALNAERAARRDAMERERALHEGTPRSNGLVRLLQVGATGLLTADGAADAPDAPTDPRAASNGATPDESAAEGAPEAPPTNPIRYTPVSDILTEAQDAAIRSLRGDEVDPIPGLILERVPVREYPGAEGVAPILGLVGWGDEGTVGAEASFESSLGARDGRVRYVQDAAGNAMWIEPSASQPAARGEDLRLSIDVEIQRMAMEELRRGVEDADAQGGRILVLDPASGAIVAMGDIVRPIEGVVPYPWTPKGSQERLPPVGQRPRYQVVQPEPARADNPAIARLRCLVDSYEPGSTFKPFVWAIALSNNVVRLDEVIDTNSWFPRRGRLVEDVRSVRAPSRSWHDVLVYSSNCGMSRVALRLQPRVLHDSLDRWGFGQRLDIGLPYEARSTLTTLRDWKVDTSVSVSFGYEVLVTPLHLARGFCAFAREGDLAGTIPSVSLVARPENDPNGVIAQRVLAPDAARMVRGPLEIVAQRMERHVRGGPEGGWAYRIFGKSGTANVPLGAPPEGFRRPVGERNYYENQYNSSFIAAGPVESPRLVILCVIDDPGPHTIRNSQHYGSYTAGPVVRRLFDRALEYLGVPPDGARDPAQVASGTGGLEG
ncbi:MAG: penicillin-binding protein 2 [Phycisphaerales bacterium]|nr:penicillin-binding protein 2 [Phycisphaerales bacterium]